MKKFKVSSAAMASLLFLSACGGGGGSGDIEAWLVEVGNDFPNEAKCVAAEMDSYAVSDFEKSFDAEINEAFESDLDAAYEKCDSLLGITTDE